MNTCHLSRWLVKLSFFITMIFLIYGCIKPIINPIIEDRSYGPMVKVNNQAKSYVLPFKIGSYWIFEDAISKKIDSVYVTYYYDGTQAEGPGEDINTSLISTNTGSLGLSLFASQDTSDGGILIIYDQPEGSIQITISATGYSGFDHSFPRPSVSVLDSFSTNSGTYRNVLYANDNAPGNTFYFAKGVGLIGRDIINGNNLAHYRLVRYKL